MWKVGNENLITSRNTWDINKIYSREDFTNIWPVEIR